MIPGELEHFDPNDYDPFLGKLARKVTSKVHPTNLVGTVAKLTPMGLAATGVRAVVKKSRKKKKQEPPRQLKVNTTRAKRSAMPDTTLNTTAPADTVASTTSTPSNAPTTPTTPTDTTTPTNGSIGIVLALVGGVIVLGGIGTMVYLKIRKNQPTATA